ncbi:MAG TPA: 50S ribosomal protein L15e [Candidatus Nanoarchaeia archaeon]|nr:50S ribosomal protein L15e [Candidatus Nanoarchaeia archaeon]
MGYQSYMSEKWTQPKENFGKEAWKKWLMQLRREPSVLRVENPTRLDRAHALGFKAKSGFVVVRSRVTKGGRKRPAPRHGRKPKRYGRFIEVRKSDNVIAEERAAKRYPNCEILNSYWVGEDGKYKWYEVILADRAQVSKYKDYAWLANPATKGRVFRGKTSAGRRSRGLRNTRGARGVQFRPSKSSKGTK